MGGTTRNTCAVCANLAEQRCAGCHVIYYCSRDHQKQHWKTHKNNCRPFKVCEDATLGRYLVATRALKAGEVVLKERPLIRGPTQITGPVCLGCGKGLLSAADCRPCAKCGWPVCSEKCETLADHQPECDYTVTRGYKVSIQNFVYPHPSYQCLTVLRCLYQRDHNPEKWRQLMALESHEQHRLNTEQYEQDRVSAQFILNFFKLDGKFSEEEILKIAGVVQVNSHEVPLTDPAHIAIYESCSLFEHNCRANCSKSFTSRGEVVIAAGIAIEEGQHISISYADPLWGTANRRHFLAETKYFDCVCNRCQDPTEFGTMLSAMKCQSSGCDGLLLPPSFVAPENGGGHTDLMWCCNKCANTQRGADIQKTLDHIGRDLQAMEKGDIASCGKFLEYYGKLLHASHYYMTDVRMALAQLIGQKTGGGLTEVPDDQLELKARLCRQISNLLLQLIPAETRVRGTLLFELHAAVAEIGRRRATNGQVGPEALEAMLLESKKLLTEAVDLLKHEPEVLPEGKLKLQAKQNLADMEKLLRTLHHNVGDMP